MKPQCVVSKVVESCWGRIHTCTHFCLNSLLLENFIIMLVCSKKMANVVLLFRLFLMLLDGKLECILCFCFCWFSSSFAFYILYNIDLHLLSIKKDILKSNRDIIGFRSIITGNQIKDKFSQPVHTSSPTPNKWIHVISH